MKDSEVTKTRQKVLPRERPPLVIEKVTKDVPRIDPFRSYSKSDGAGVYVNRVSLPRVKWLERPDV